MAVRSDEFFGILEALAADVEQAEGNRYTSFSVHGTRFGYYWPRTQTVGLKQTLSEQRALVSERPDVFEEQFTSGGFGWVVIYLAGIEGDELSELVFEAWRLSAPDDLIAKVPDRARPGTPSFPPGPTPWKHRRPQGVSEQFNPTAGDRRQILPC